jgi:hypothetical protein
LEEKRNLLSEQVIDESNAGMRNELETELRAVPLRYVFIPMRLRLSAVFGHRHRWIRILGLRKRRNYLDQRLMFERSSTKITSTITRTQALTVAITAPTLTTLPYSLRLLGQN